MGQGGNEQSVCLCRALCFSMWHCSYMVLWILHSLTERLLSTTLKNIQEHSRGGCLAMGEELSWKQPHLLQTPSAVLEQMLRALLESQVFGCTCPRALWLIEKSLQGPTSSKHVRTQPRAQIIFALLVTRAKVFEDASMTHVNPRYLKSALRKTRDWFVQIPDFHVCNLPRRTLNTQSE